MVSPEGTSAPTKPPSGKKALALTLAACTLGLGAIAFGALTAPDEPVAAPTTTTTTRPVVERPVDMDNFSVAEIARGEPLNWRQVEVIEESYPVGLVAHDGWVYLFATDQRNYFAPPGGGLSAWRSEDGMVWESLGQVIGPNHLVGRVASTAHGLVTLEVDPEGSGLVLWSSVDGMTWLPETIPTGDRSDLSTVYPQAIGGNDNILVVVGSIQINTQEMLQSKLETQVAGEIDLSTFGWSSDYVNDDWLFTIWGPLGLKVVEITGTELGLTEEERQLLSDSRSAQSPTRVWVSTEGGEWLESETPPPEIWVNSIFASPTGEILMLGYGNSGLKMLSSWDGFNWEETIASGQRPTVVRPWNGSLVGPSQLGQGTLLISADGVEWEELGPAGGLPGPIQWELYPMAAGPGGIVAALRGWDPADGARASDADNEPAVVEKGQATLALDFMNGQYTVQKGGSEYTWTINSETIPEGIEVDLAAATITFSDITNDEPLLTVGFDDVQDAEIRFWSEQGSNASFRALLFTPDGEEWVIQDMQTALGVETYFDALVVTESSIVGTASSDLRFGPRAAPGFEIWAAPLP